jgi:acyl-CoA hydrolase
MRNYEAEYRSKLMTKEDLIGRFKPRDYLVLGCWYGEPYGVMATLVEHGGEISPLCTYSGLGGSVEFTIGAQLSPGGMSFLCLPSTTALKDGRVVSNIVAGFQQGTRITILEHMVDWAVTEYGAVRLRPLTLEQRAGALLEIAHPDFLKPLAGMMEKAGMDLSRTADIPEPPTNLFAGRS